MLLARPLAAAAATAAAAALGQAGADPDTAWFHRLDKPNWQAPNAAFGPVWGELYAALARAGMELARHDRGGRRDLSGVVVASRASTPAKR